MKRKLLLLIIINLFFLPFIVNAKSHYIYDVLKEEAENGGLAKEYTREHHDSFTEEPSKKIYHWYASNNTEGVEVQNKNNVIFGNFCWQIIRTTDTGGVKLLFNGNPKNGKCTNYYDSIYSDYFNESEKSVAYLGYMFNPNTLTMSNITTSFSTYGKKYGKNVTYSNGIYTLSDLSSNIDDNHHYTCESSSSTCSTVRYYYTVVGVDAYYIELSGGLTVETALENMLSADNVNATDSVIKSIIDEWYEYYLLDYNDKIEDTIYCDNRTVYDKGGWDPNGGSISQYSYLIIVSPGNLSCQNITDMFSLSNNKAKLTYPVGLLTISEYSLIGNSNVIHNSSRFWLMDPGRFQYTVASVHNSDIIEDVNKVRDIKPVISLIDGIKYVEGTGSKENPYVIRDLNKSNIVIDNDDTKGTISNLDNIINIEELTEINFTITPAEGYKVQSINIKDNNDNIIEYMNVDNQYTFTMPGSNITITPVYEKVKNSINIEIVNETKDLNININDLTQVEFEEEVNFTITPIKGFKLNNVKILDSNENEITYTTTDNINYQFIMPASDVTIIPSYERVSNAINVEDNKNTKEIEIEVNDAKAVVYEDTVKFTIIPEEGFEVETIEIIDKNNNKIEYKKLSNNNYEFKMPDTDVTIKLAYKKIEKLNVIDVLNNPNTGDRVFLIILLITISLWLGTIIYKKKESKLKL